MSCLIAVLVVPDELAADRFAAGDLPYLSELNVNLASDSQEQAMKDLMAEYGKAAPPSEELAETGWTYESSAWPVSYYDTSESVIADSMGIKLLLVYLALYIGFVFLMTTAAVLSVQQLSEVADSIPALSPAGPTGMRQGHGAAKPAHADRHLLRGSASGCRMPLRMHDQPSVQEPAVDLGLFDGCQHACRRHRTVGRGVCDLPCFYVPGRAFRQSFPVQGRSCSLRFGLLVGRG